jgi:tyrosyl-tRNA synthetase
MLLLPQYCEQAAFVAKTLHPLDLKSGVAAALNALMAPVRAAFSSKKLQTLAANAYPVEKKVRSATPRDASSCCA